MGTEKDEEVMRNTTIAAKESILDEFTYLAARVYGPRKRNDAFEDLMKEFIKANKHA